MKLPKEQLFNCYIAKLLNWKKRFNDSTIQRFNEGFSLIELLIVISIIGILVAAATVSWTNAQQKSRDSKRKSDLKSIQQALELYLQDNSTYPEADASGLIKCPSLGGIQWGGNFICNSKTYMNPLPKDPLNVTAGNIDHTYYYEPDSTPPILTYKLSAGLENSKDPEYCTEGFSPPPNDCVSTGKLPCNPAARRNYCVINP